MTDTIAINMARLESKVELLEERNQMLMEQINNLKERIKDLEVDKGFLLREIEEKNKQIAKKDEIISKLTPLALPKPKATITERFKRLFGRSNDKT